MLGNRYMNVVMLSPYAPIAFTPQEMFLVHISVTGRVDNRATVRPDGFKSIGSPIDLIETATCRLVVQCLKKLRHRVPHSIWYEIKKVAAAVTISRFILIFISIVIKSSRISLAFLRDTYHYTFDTNVL